MRLNIPWLCALLLALLPSTANAIIIRHDVSDSQYRVAASEFPALVDLPGEGHGVLIAPRWVLTAAHAISWQHEVKCVMLNGTPRAVQRLVIYPGYEKLPQQLIDRALQTGDATDTTKFLASSNDIALIELKEPVRDVKPASIFRGDNEMGQIVEIIGKGGTGTGLTGQVTGNRTELRRAFNTITEVQDRWLCYSFQKPPAARTLEGITGNGDSGGPALIQVKDHLEIAGLASWKKVQGDARTFRAGVYGTTTCTVRVSHYAEWIDGTISAGTP